MEEQNRTTQSAGTTDNVPTPPQPDTATASGDTSSDATAIAMSTRDLNKRLERERRKAVKDLLSELGINDVETLKAKLTVTSGTPEPITSETLSVADSPEIADMKAKLARLEAEAEATRAERERQAKRERADTLKAAIGKWGVERKLPDGFADKALRLAKGSDYDLEALFDDDGSIDTDALKTFTDWVRTESPEWFKPAGPGVPSSHGGVPESIDADERRKASVNLRQITGGL